MKELLDADCSVRILCRNPDKLKDESGLNEVKIFQGDTLHSDPSELSKVLFDQDVTHVVICTGAGNSANAAVDSVGGHNRWQTVPASFEEKSLETCSKPSQNRPKSPAIAFPLRNRVWIRLQTVSRPAQDRLWKSAAQRSPLP